MKIFVTGHEGNIGRSLLSRGCFPFDCDVTKPDLVRDTVLREKPDLIIHCAALTDVNFCEAPENAELVIQTNLKGTTNVLEIAEINNIPVIVMSSDHVFDGRRGNYSEKDSPKPLNFYGLSKATMEAACSSFQNANVVRTSALFARGMKDFGEFEQSLRTNTGITVPTVLYRSFVHVEHFVQGLLVYAHLINQSRGELPKILHISGTENISWHELALAMADLGGYNPKLISHRNHNDNTFVPRPLNGGLNVSLARKIGIPLYSFQDGLKLIYG